MNNNISHGILNFYLRVFLSGLNLNWFSRNMCVSRIVGFHAIFPQLLIIYNVCFDVTFALKTGEFDKYFESSSGRDRGDICCKKSRLSCNIKYIWR